MSRGQGQPLLPRRGQDGTRRILRAPRAPGPAASCAVPSCEARGTGRAAGGGDGSRALPGRWGEESGGEDGPRSVHPVPQAWVPGARRGIPAEGVTAPKLCQGRGSPRVLPAAVGPRGSHAPGGIPRGKPRRLHRGRAMGSRVGGGLCEPVPRRCRPGQRVGGKGRRLHGEPAHGRLRPAHRLSWRSPVHPWVPRCQRGAGGAVLPGCAG